MGAEADTTRLRTLLGRDVELDELAALCEHARHGDSGALLLTGAAGVGKSVLLEDLVAGQDGGCVVLRTSGNAAEADLPYAGLHRLLNSQAHRFGRLSQAHRGALLRAIDSADVPTEQRFLLGTAVLMLLAEIAAEAPVLACADDLHLMDEPSASVLGFVARRLDAGTTPDDAAGIAFVGARRAAGGRFDDGSGGCALSGIPARELGCLDAADSAALLARHCDGPVGPDVAAAIAEGTGGNPLALVELSGLLATEQLAGREPLAEPLPVGARTCAAYGKLAGPVTAAMRQLLVIAAAEETGDMTLLARAAERAGLPADVLEDVEATGLVTIASARLRFACPLDRSALYQRASRRERRAAHKAVAAALPDPEDADQRAWHLATTEFGPSEALASELERAAPLARVRGGYPAGALLLQRAGLLSPDQRERSRRFTAAAADACLAGRTRRAVWLAESAERAHPDEHVAARLSLLRGELELCGGNVGDAYAALLTAGQRLAAHAPSEALRAFACAGEAAGYAGDAGRMAQACDRATALDLAEADPADRMLLDILRGSSDVLRGNPVAGTEHLRSALSQWGSTSEPRMLARLAAAATLAGDDAGAHSIARSAIEAARASGALSVVPHATEYLVGSELFRGAYESAQARADEGIRIAEETGQLGSGCVLRADLALIAAFRGDERACRSHAALALRTATTHGIGLAAGMANWALGMVDLGMSRIPAAVQRLSGIKGAGPGAGHPMVVLLSMPHWVEALVRHDPPDHTSAQRLAANFGGWAAQADQPWALALSERCAALLAGDDSDAGEHFQLALRLHGQSGRPFDTARTALLYGEFLRRNRNRAPAKVQLRSAWETFDRLGSVLWEQRARGELRACGETVTANGPEAAAPSGLTAQELRIARLVAGGATNREVAAQLYVSPRTVDYHLRKVFHRLGISSRVELARIDI